MEEKDEEEEEVEYNPYIHRPGGIQLNSNLVTSLHLMKSTLGTGILFMPHEFRKTGYIGALICGVFMGLLSTHTALILVRSAQNLCKRYRYPMLSLAKTAEISFQAGPENIRKCSKGFGTIVNVIVCLVHFQSIVIYILYVATSFQQVFEFHSGTRLDPRICILLLYPFVVCLGQIPNLKYLTPFSVFGILFLATGICITFYYTFVQLPDPRRLEIIFHPLQTPVFCTIFLYALHNTTIYLPLENTMKHPQSMPRLIVVNVLFSMIIYLIFGFFGFNKYVKACDTIIKNLPIDESLAEAVKITISLSVLFTFGLAYYVPIITLWPIIALKIVNGRHRRYFEIIFRLCGVTLATLVAVGVPQMVPLLGLTSAFSMTTMMLLIPILIETATKWEEGLGRYIIFKNALIFCLWLVLLCFGSIESLSSIIEEYGSPKEEGC